MDTSNAPPHLAAVENVRAINSVDTDPAFPPPAVSEYREPQEYYICWHTAAGHCICTAHCANVNLEGGRCNSIPSHSEFETVRQHVCVSHHGSSGETADLVRQANLEGSPSYEVEGLNQSCSDPCEKRTFGFRVSDHESDGQSARADSSGWNTDVEKGWDLKNVKQAVDEDQLEEGQGAGRCCRVCHLSAEILPNSGSDVIKLGCACKDDLAVAHLRCAETWFKIKGNRTCEICGSTAQNVFVNGERRSAELIRTEETSCFSLIRATICWRNQALCNTLLVCVLLVLFASWFFRATLF